MDWQTSEDTVPSAPVTEADARLLLGRPPATGAWQLPPTPYKEPVFGARWLPREK